MVFHTISVKWRGFLGIGQVYKSQECFTNCLQQTIWWHLNTDTVTTRFICGYMAHRKKYFVKLEYAFEGFFIDPYNVIWN